MRLYDSLSATFNNKNVQILFLALVVFTWSFGLITIISLGISDENFLNTTSSFANVVISAALAYLYTKMMSVQNKQASIQGTQTELLRANHAPSIDICSVNIVNNNEIQVELSNFGNGIAQDLQTETEVEYSADWCIMNVGYSSLKLSDDDINDERDILQPGERCLPYKGNVVVKFYDKEEDREQKMTISGFFREVARHDGESKMSIRVNVYYENIMGNSDCDEAFVSTDLVIDEETEFGAISKDVELEF
ncbi:hypothetical protein SAMN04487950_2855 [Halogranum rubrum]|uniref:Uncharacterized protein n=1 Tax=Halogranum rubrum TaxID=553466 RepID=A0A1I4FV29_9EURY|nr:hypothetical protein [Halogranum rubrum]SFL21694.1 hypothetical protein SAMN04487950_2855 [Halogranum rubrum]